MACFLKMGTLTCLISSALRDVAMFRNSELVQRLIYLPHSCPDAAWTIFASWPNVHYFYFDVCCMNCTFIPARLVKTEFEPPSCRCNTTEEGKPLTAAVIGGSFAVLVLVLIVAVLIAAICIKYCRTKRHCSQDSDSVIPPPIFDSVEQVSADGGQVSEGAVPPLNFESLEQIAARGENKSSDRRPLILHENA